PPPTPRRPTLPHHAPPPTPDASLHSNYPNSNPIHQDGYGVFEMVCCYSSKASNYLGSFTRDDANSSNKILGAVNDTLTPGWHHVAYTNDLDGRAYIYMDGQLVDSSDVGTGTYVVAGFPLIVGADNANNSDNYEGKIDDIRLYRGLLTSSEVDSLFNEAIATSTESLSSDISYHLFPNPVKDRLMIELVKPQPEAYRVEMMSSIGTSVHTSTQILPSAYPGAYSIDMGNLPNGLYVLRISRNGKVLAYEKVVKQ
ncbi:MAG: LamG-like jellyroll fold domain-containing protein, partial [Bacteroidota bacterium]